MGCYPHLSPFSLFFKSPPKCIVGKYTTFLNDSTLLQFWRVKAQHSRIRRQPSFKWLNCLGIIFGVDVGGRFTVTHNYWSTKNKPKIRWLLSWLGKVPRKALDIQIFPLPNFTTKLLFSMGNHGMRRSSFFLLLFYSLSRIEGGFLKKHYVWKSFKMSHSTLRAKRATFIFW